MRYWGLLTVVMVLAACGGAPATSVSNPPSADMTATFTNLETNVAATDAAGMSSTSPATSGPAVVTPATTAPATAATPPGGLLTVTILSPEDNVVVSAPQVEITGQSAPNAVITLNDEITLADATGAFSAAVPLVEGPNVIEVVASDVDGNEAVLQLFVTYDSGS